MVYENDILEIPEKYKKMSLAELQEEEERMLKTMEIKKTREVRQKIEACPIKFNL
jgi:hypothetical protein